MVVTEVGRLLTIGNGGYGQLGNSDMRNVAVEVGGSESTGHRRSMQQLRATRTREW